MQVRELRAHLATLPDDADVFVMDLVNGASFSVVRAIVANEVAFISLQFERMESKFAARPMLRLVPRSE